MTQLCFPFSYDVPDLSVCVLVQPILNFFVVELVQCTENGLRLIGEDVHFLECLFRR